MTEAIYIEAERWRRLIEALAAIKPCPYMHRVTPDQIGLALGEFGEIWPEAINRDRARS